MVKQRRGVQMLNNAGIQVILDLHAAPGAQVTENAFTGVCATTPEFYVEPSLRNLVPLADQLLRPLLITLELCVGLS